jgi:hypothetical protein
VALRARSQLALVIGNIKAVARIFELLHGVRMSRREPGRILSRLLFSQIRGLEVTVGQTKFASTA